MNGDPALSPRHPQVKGETERHERLVEIQNKLEQNGFSRVDNPIVNEFNGVSRAGPVWGVTGDMSRGGGGT